MLFGKHREEEKIVQVFESELAVDGCQYNVHCALKRARCVLLTKFHSSKSVQSMRRCEGRFVLAMVVDLRFGNSQNERLTSVICVLCVASLAPALADWVRLLDICDVQLSVVGTEL